MSPTKPLCGVCVDGWIVDPATLLPSRRCPCRLAVTDPAIERDKALAAVSAGNANAMRAAMKIITDTAMAREYLTADDVRIQMHLADVPKNTIGTAFRLAGKRGIIRRVGSQPSGDAPTHLALIGQWQSLIYRHPQLTLDGTG